MQKQIYTFALVISYSLLAINSFSQNGFTSNNNELEDLYDRYSILYSTDTLFNDVKPYNNRDIKTLIRDNEYVTNELSHIFQELRKERKKVTGLFYGYPESFLQVTKPNFYIRVNPILELKVGKEKDNSNMLYQAFRGGEITGSIGDKLNFYAQITENQYRPFSYIRQYGNGFNGQNNYNFNPYYTYWKNVNANQGYDFSNAIGYVEYNPNRHFSLMMGHDRNHYGYGYRSLFLGNNGAPYFQLKANAYIWKFHYQMMFAQMTGQYVRGADRLLPKKYAAFHLLTFKPNKKWDIGLFEGIIFHRNDGFDLNYLNPVIFYHSIEHSLGSSDNVLMGLQAKYNLNEHTQFYTQFLLDDIQVGEFLKKTGWWGNKYGVQFGARFINIFDIPQLDAQLELNAVRPYTYSHYSNDGTDTIDNYTHYNQPLAHPYGANFVELHSKLTYRPISKLKLELLYNHSIRGYDINGTSYGNNIFYNTTGNTIPQEYNNTWFQGDKTTQQFLMASGQYQFFHNMFWDLDIFFRRSQSNLTTTSQSMWGVSTGLRINLRKRDNIF